MDSFMKRSSITGRTYDYFSKDIVRILNLQQAFFYIDELNIVPLDIVMSTDRNNPNKKVIVFIFSKQESNHGYKLWIERNNKEEK